VENFLGLYASLHIPSAVSALLAAVRCGLAHGAPLHHACAQGYGSALPARPGSPWPAVLHPGKMAPSK